MAQRVNRFFAAIFFRLGELAAGKRDERTQILKAIRVDELEEDGSVAEGKSAPECRHENRIAAPVMGRPLKWICRDCPVDGDGRIEDGD